jgi:hypothetical protein
MVSRALFAPSEGQVTMIVLEVFDPAMCCSTGVCGVEVDPRLPRFAADLEWLTSLGGVVELRR